MKKIKISCEEMITMVTKEFIIGSDTKYLKKVEKTAKGGGIFNDVGKSLRNNSKTFSFCVLQPLFFFMKSKDVIIIDEKNKIMHLMRIYYIIR